MTRKQEIHKVHNVLRGNPNWENHGRNGDPLYKRIQKKRLQSSLMHTKDNPLRVLSKFIELCCHSLPLTHTLFSVTLSQQRLTQQRLATYYVLHTLYICPKYIYTYTLYGLFTNVATATVIPIITIIVI